MRGRRHPLLRSRRPTLLARRCEAQDRQNLYLDSRMVLDELWLLLE